MKKVKRRVKIVIAVALTLVLLLTSGVVFYLSKLNLLQFSDGKIIWNNVLPLVQTNLTKLEITELLLLAPKYRGVTIQQMTVPIKGSYGGIRGAWRTKPFLGRFRDKRQGAKRIYLRRDDRLINGMNELLIY